jgi:hypothetical protein
MWNTLTDWSGAERVSPCAKHLELCRVSLYTLQQRWVAPAVRGASSAVSVIHRRSTLDDPVPQHGERSLVCCEVRRTAFAALSFPLHAACAANLSYGSHAFPSAIPAGNNSLNNLEACAQFAEKLLVQKALAASMRKRATRYAVHAG